MSIAYIPAALSLWGTYKHQSVLGVSTKKLHVNVTLVAIADNNLKLIVLKLNSTDLRIKEGTDLVFVSYHHEDPFQSMPTSGNQVFLRLSRIAVNVDCNDLIISQKC